MKAPSKAQAKRELEEEAFAHIQSLADGILEAQDARSRSRTVSSFVKDQIFYGQLTDALGDVFKNKIPAPPAPSKKSKVKTERILNVIFSDTHYGANLDPREVGSQYTPVCEARRTAAVCRQVADYKREHRDSTELYVHILGDIIQGQLHDPRDGVPLAEQVARALRILVQATCYLAHEFPKGVTVFCATGNHGRNKARHEQRGVNQKWDSLETMVYLGLKEAMRDYENVTVEIPLSPYYSWQAFDQRGFATHGDTVLNGGFPNRSIQVESVTKQINSINASAGRVGPEYSLFIIGHVHTGSQTHLGAGATFMTNGCLIPPDSYAVSIGIFETSCGQWCFESVKGHIVGDSRFIRVDQKTDKDASLDAIIKPFSGM